VARHIPLESVPAAQRERSPLKLLIGATDVLNGERVVFGNHHRHRAPPGRLGRRAAPVPRHRDRRAALLDGCSPATRRCASSTDETLMGEKPTRSGSCRSIRNARRPSRSRSATSTTAQRAVGQPGVGAGAVLIEKINELTERMAAHPRVAGPTRASRCVVVEMPLAGSDYAS
jgi:hypothetical protein